jgi:hypothetical protein
VYPGQGARQRYIVEEKQIQSNQREERGGMPANGRRATLFARGVSFEGAYALALAPCDTDSHTSASLSFRLVCSYASSGGDANPASARGGSTHTRNPLFIPTSTDARAHIRTQSRIQIPVCTYACVSLHLYAVLHVEGERLSGEKGCPRISHGLDFHCT